MDYDDNDFQGQNLQLAGEESSKFSPVLLPYALPKFDFDDGLQGHLRFDSLVENEVFLGIPSQEDNQWIEDFSQGSSGIEFSSSAAESCSISRRNNVWSEATSSESVEMLLKSVGQEEMVPGETIIEESDACDELGGLSEQMEPHLKQDEKVNNVMDSEPALPSDEFLEHFSRSNVVEGSSQIQEAEVSTHGSSHELDPNASIETCGIIVAENNPGVDRKCDDANQTEVDTSVNESLDNKMQKDSSGSGIEINESLDNRMQKDSSGSGIEIDAIDSSSQDIAARIPECLTPEPEHQASDVSFENANSLFKDTGKAVEEHHVLNKEADADNQNLMRIVVESGTHNLENQPCSSSNAVSIGQHAIDTDISNFEEPSSLPLKGDGNLQIAEGCSEDLCSTNPEKASKCEFVVSSNRTEIHSQFSRNMNEDLPVVCDSNPEGHASGDSNMKAGIRGSSELQIDQTTDGENSSVVGKAYVRGSDRQLDSEASVPNSEASLLTGVENKLFDGQGVGSCGNYVGDLLSSTVEYSSTELLGEKHTVENLKGMDNASGVHKEDLNAEDHALSHVVAVSMQTYGGNVVLNPNDEHYNKNVAFNENENSKLPNDSICMDCEIVESLTSDKRVEPFPEEEGMEINNEVVHGSECVTIARNEPVSNVAFGKKNFASHVDGATLLSETGATFDQVTDHLDKTKRTEDEGPIETNLLSLKDGSEGASELGPLLELEKGASPSSAWKLSHKPVDQSLSTLETCNSASMSEQSVKLLHTNIDQSLPMVETSNTASGSEEAVKANEISQNSSNKLEVCPIGDSAVKEGGDAEGLLVAENHEEVAVEKKHEVASSKVANAVPVSNKGEVLTEPTFITLSEFRSNMGQNDHEGNEAVMESRVSDSGKTPPSSKGGGGFADSVKPNCGSPTVISCTVLSQSEDKKEGVEDSVGTRVSFSEVTAQSTSQNVSGNDAAKDDRSFTFEVHPSPGLSERESSKDGQSMTTIQACKIPTIVEGSSSTPSIGQIDSKMVSELSRGSSQTPVGVTARGGSIGTPERKTRRASVRATGKENAKKGNHVKGTTPVRQAERRDKSCSMSVSLAGTGQIVQLEGLKPYGNVERSGTMPCVISIPTSNLPDLNTSAPPSALFQQPFTDLQQVQLRAQIFVYGSLIQGAAPDEACMVSAFGASDGGRSVWEPGWRTCAERIQGQKSHPNKSQIPVQPRSVDRTPDQSIKQGTHQSKVVPSPLGRASSKGTPSPVVSSMIPLSSPLWNISTTPDGLHSSGMPRSSLLDYNQTLPPLHPFQNTPTRSFVGPTASWLSQAPFPGPWVASPQTSAFDASVRFSVLPLTETVKLTPVKESSPPVSSGTKRASPSTMVHTTGPSVLAGTSSLPDMKKMTVVPGQHSTDLKTRKRKKVTVSEDLGQMSLLAQTQTGSVSAPVVSSHLSTTVVISTPSCFASKGNASKIVTAVSPMSSTDQPKRGGHNEGQKVVISEETLGKVEEAKRQAEDAAALAAAAVSHSQSVWSRLDKQKNSGLIPDVESKLASAAVAIAAAASVAKAAAAAAKIASNAALQAKLMADEALTSGGTSNPAQNNAASLPDVVNNLGKTTPASNLKGGDGSNCSSSIIVAAREAARRRVEAASAASKHAENLDAIVKAAVLAAEAVSQAGKIVAMGDPLLLKELVENGPEGYWRVPQFPSEQGVILSTNNRERSKVDSIEGLNDPGRHAEDGPSQEAKTTNHCLSSLSSEVSRGSMADHMRVVDGISSSFTISEMDSRGQRSRRASDLAKTIGVVPESEIESRSVSISAQDECEKRVGTLKENNIKEGCLVEVRKDGDEFKTAWFSANVLSLKDGKAFVCYTELQSDKGSGKLKEWVALEGEANNAPRIRIAYPTTTRRFEGTRKRRRAAMGDYVWSVGDRVDVWLQDCWREGVVSEKNKKDDSTLTVHFPVEGETSVVKVWHLRPTLIWKDGEWIECSGSKVKDPSPQGDTPQEKRLKLGIPAIEDREMDKMSKNIELVESGKPDGSRLLPLSANEKLFNVGKNIVDENKPNALRTIRSGLQKEGSRVIIGIPKPGKKRKFMEVSKHYVAERSSKTNESNDSVKFAKYLMPQGSGSRGWKNNNKTDAKEKQAAESKTKVLKSGKPPNVPGKTIPQKDKFLASSLSAPNDGFPRDSMIKDSVSTVVNESGQQSLMEFGSFSNTDVAAEGPVLFSSLALPSDVPSKKISTSNAKTEQVNRGKFATSGGRLVRVEVKDNLNNGNPGKSIPDVAEPRRSNRRIQPTSRLLEGLQSSLIISKIPAVPHDKSRRSQNRGTSKGNNHG